MTLEENMYQTRQPDDAASTHDKDSPLLLKHASPEQGDPIIPGAEGKIFKLAEGAKGPEKNFFQYMNGISKNPVPVLTPNDTPKPGRSFVHPGTMERVKPSKAMPPSPKDSELEFGRHDSRGPAMSMGIGNSVYNMPTPRSYAGDNTDSLLDPNRAFSQFDHSLGKRSSQLNTFEQDLLHNDPLYTSKRRLGDMTAEVIRSPQPGNSGNNSPAHSAGGGFKLHSSRKNSELIELETDNQKLRGTEEH